MSKLKTSITLFFILFYVLDLNAQNIKLDSLRKQQLFNVSGGVSMTASNYLANSMQGREPFSFYASGNVSFSFLDISLPVSFNYSNNKFTTAYTQPFNQFSLHPTYRWAQGHFGWCSSSFSPYSLNGFNYYGTGVDLKIPKTNISLTAMYGRLLKGINGDSLKTIVGNDTSYNVILPIFKRMGYGAKVTYDKKGKNLSISYFKAYDDKQSIKYENEKFSVFPESNDVFTVSGSANLDKNLKISGELGTSIMQKKILRKRDIVYGSNGDNYSIVDSSSTSKTNYKAMKCNLTYAVPKTFTSFGVGFERIDPGYKTLGAYFFNNDLQNITFNFGQQVYKGKIALNGSLGMQKDNLDKQKANNNNRILHNYSINIIPTSRFNINANYSNFTTISLINNRIEDLDKLLPSRNLDTFSRYSQIAQSANVGISYALSTSKEASQHINLNVSFNDTKEILGSLIRGAAAAKIYTANLGYNISLSEIKTNITIAANYMRNQYAVGSAEAIGGTLVLSKPLFAIQLPLNFSASYNTTKQSNVKSGGVCNMRLGTSYTMLKKHNFSLSMMALIRKSAGNNGQPSKTIYENASQLSYNYSF